MTNNSVPGIAEVVYNLWQRELDAGRHPKTVHMHPELAKVLKESAHVEVRPEELQIWGLRIEENPDLRLEEVYVR